MKRFLDSAWFSFTRLFQWHRVAGIGTLTLVTWLLVSHFSHLDVGWLLPQEPTATKPRFQWPDLPTFSVTSQNPKVGSRKAETLFTVPTRQITRRELSQLPPDLREKDSRPSFPPSAQ